MGTNLPLKIHERGEGVVKTGRYGLFLKVGTEERMMDFLESFAGEKKY